MHCHDMTLNNGVNMPRGGFGGFKVAPADTVAAVASALEAGYRLVDTASAYGNEREVGEAIAAGGLKREEIFVTTKLWVTQYGYDPARRGIAAGLAKLGLEYADMVLLHFPVPSAFEDTIAAYRALEQELRTAASGPSAYATSTRGIWNV